MKKNRALISFLLLVVVTSVVMVSSICYGQKDMGFTKEEDLFIANNPVIKIGVDPEFMPYEFVGKDGQYQGIASDYIKYIERVSGLEFKVVDGLRWKEAYNLAVVGEIDVLPCVSMTASRKDLFLFSDAYYNFKRVIVVKEDNDVITSQTDLLNQVVAVQENSSHHSYLMNHTPYELNTYETVEAALQAVSLGEEFAFIGNLATTQYVVNNSGFTNLKYFEFKSETVSGLHFAISRDMPLLQSIINKSLNMMTVEERTEIHNKWIGMEKEADYSAILDYILYGGFIVGLILLISFYWIVKLRKEIKKRNEIEEALIIARQEAEASNYIKSTFLARMSHEIRTPLNGITGMCFLLSNSDLDYKQQGQLERIKEASHTMLGIINDILDFSKVEAGKIEIEKTPFDLDGVIKNVLNIVAYKIEEKELGFTLRQKPAMPNRFIGDPKRIEQVLMNVINNAVKFTHKGGITLSIDSNNDAEGLDQIVFRIKDTGIGVDPSRLGSLFEAFTQEDSSITRRFGGTGLGLSITKNIVELMGGQISVESQLEVGTEFTITIPLEVDPTYDEKELSHEMIFNGTKAIILDQSGVQLKVVHSYLSSFGIQAALTTSLDELISQLEKAVKGNEAPYDLIIVDYETPNCGVEELYKRFESNELTKQHTKWLIMLPFLRDDLSLAFDGDHICITKPIFPSVLLDALLHLFDPESFVQEREQYSMEESLVDLSQENYRILLVEDNKTNQIIAKSLLEDIGVSVDLADDGQEGLDRYRDKQEDYQLVLMDLHMPIMDGYEATKGIRSFDQDVPIMALTADAITGVEEKCKSYGFTHFMSKPFVPEAFARTIGDLLSNTERGTTAYKEDEVDHALWNRDLGLKMLGGNEKLFDEVLNVYLAENVQTLDELKFYYDQRSYEEAAKLVHKVKSSTGSIGSDSVRQLASELQQALEASNEEQITLFYNRFNTQFAKLLDVIKEKNK